MVKLYKTPGGRLDVDWMKIRPNAKFGSQEIPNKNILLPKIVAKKETHSKNECVHLVS